MPDKTPSASLEYDAFHKVSDQQKRLAKNLNGGTRTETFLVSITMAADLPHPAKIAAVLPELLTGGSFLGVAAEVYYEPAQNPPSATEHGPVGDR